MARSSTSGFDIGDCSAVRILILALPVDTAGGYASKNDQRRELWACADELLRQHDAGAAGHAAERQAALEAAGDEDGHRTWVTIGHRLQGGRSRHRGSSNDVTAEPGFGQQLGGALVSEASDPSAYVGSVMPLGSRHRVSGLLKRASRGFVLEVDDGGAWALDLDQNPRPMLGRRVTVEGVRSGFDRLDVKWIGSADPR